MSLAHGRLALIASGLAVGLTVLVYGHDLTDGNAAALRLQVMIFSILTGFLAGAIALMGDPKLLYSGGWRVASAHRRAIGQALHRYLLLFYAYLLVLLLSLAAELCRDLVTEVPLLLWIERASFSLGTAALWWSAGLPTRLLRVQMDALDDEVQRRRENETA